MLEVENVSAGYGLVQILWGVSFRIREKEIVSIIGPNGAGKTTLVKTIVGLLPAKSGTIRFKGENIEKRPTYEIVKKGITMIPEGREIFPRMTVEENLRLGAYTVKDKAKVNETKARVYQIFPVLKKREKALAQTLSGGEQQMLVICRRQDDYRRRGERTSVQRPYKRSLFGGLNVNPSTADKYWNKEIETTPRPELKKQQFQLFKEKVKFCYDNTTFYRNKLKNSGVSPNDIKTFEDIQKIPFTIKDDLRDNYPLGMVAVNQDDIVEIHASSGTTGNPVVGAYTRSDMDVWQELMARRPYPAGGRVHE